MRLAIKYLNRYELDGLQRRPDTLLAGIGSITSAATGTS